MTDATELAAAFDAALAQVERAASADLRTRTGATARRELDDLRTQLVAERARATARGTADSEWVRRVVRSVADWTPETELALLAALGRIARAGAR